MAKFKILYVYILRCSDGSYYTGITNDLDRRISEHETGYDKDAYTYTRRPLKLVWHEMFNNYSLAIEWETRLKKWSKKKKEALIRSDWKTLAKESECKNKSSYKFYKKPEKQEGDNDGLDYARPDKPLPIRTEPIISKPVVYKKETKILNQEALTTSGLDYARPGKAVGKA